MDLLKAIKLINMLCYRGKYNSDYISNVYKEIAYKQLHMSWQEKINFEIERIATTITDEFMFYIRAVLNMVVQWSKHGSRLKGPLIDLEKINNWKKITGKNKDDIIPYLKFEFEWNSIILYHLLNVNKEASDYTIGLENNLKGQIKNYLNDLVVNESALLKKLVLLHSNINNKINTFS